MANAATMKYASRSVYGSNAYALQPERKYIPEPEVQEQDAPRRVPKTAARPQIRYGISPLAVCGFVVVAVLLVLVLLAYVKLADAAFVTTELETQLAELTEEERRLQIAYEEAFDINEIEDYAVNVLGMVQPSASQINIVDISTADKAVVLDGSSGEDSPVSDFIVFIKSLLEYF